MNKKEYFPPFLFDFMTIIFERMRIHLNNLIEIKRASKDEGKSEVEAIEVAPMKNGVQGLPDSGANGLSPTKQNVPLQNSVLSLTW